MTPFDRTHDHTMSALAPTPTKPKGTSEYTTVTVGHGSAAVSIQTLVAPSIHALIPDKAMAFDFLFKQLRAFLPLLSASDLTTALANHFDVNHSIARSETATIIAAVHAALFCCENLSGVRFLHRNGAAAGTVDEDPAKRPDDLAFFVFDTTVAAVTVDPRLSAINPFSLRFALPLPQSDRPSTPGTTTPPRDDARAGTGQQQTFEQQMQALLDDASLVAVDIADSDAPTRLSELVAQMRTVISQTQVPRQLFPSITRPGSFAPFSPKMARILASSDAAGTLPTYLGRLDFLDNQTAFDTVFPSPILPLEDNGTPGDHKSSNSVPNRIEAFLHSCELDLFASILRLDYVGSDATTSPEMIRQISDRLRRLSIVYQLRGQTVTCRVDDLFKKYLSEVPVLPDDTRLWGFTLTNYFWSALPEEMQTRITEDKLYAHPDMSTLITKTAQLNELRKLREAAVQASKEISDADAKLTRMIAEGLKKHQPHQRPAHPAPTAAVHAAMTSAAETVMTQYSTPAPTTHYGPAPVTDPVVDPQTGYVSPHSRDFRGCLGCGDPTHQYRDCSKNRTEPTHTNFTKNFLARYPEKRKYAPRPEEITALVTIPVFTPPPATIAPGPGILRTTATGGIGRGAGAVLPAWMTRGRDGPSPPADDDSAKRVRLCTILVKILQQSTIPSPRLKPFPIQVNNSMPAITFQLGTSLTAAVSLVCLYDTCAAVCSGNLLFHQWVISTYPDLVHSFEQFDDANPFEAIKLLGAVQDPASFDEEAHGRLTAVVRYRMPYTDSASHPTVLCIALGADVSVNTILGWPAIEDLGITLCLKTKSFFSSTLNHTFPLERVAAPCGLPPDIDFDPARDFRRPPIAVAASIPAPVTADRCLDFCPVPVPNSTPFAAELIPDAVFDPSSQMKALCQHVNTIQAGRHMLAPGPSAAAIMHGRASGAPEPLRPTVTAAASTTSGYTHGAVPTTPS
jgi:hypothetical protein